MKKLWGLYSEQNQGWHTKGDQVTHYEDVRLAFAHALGFGAWEVCEIGPRGEPLPFEEEQSTPNLVPAKHRTTGC